eukprot:CAMPEP_0119544098 /NCGR_PEP_ID=MMETSP1344-20130328/54534_1 /TAXON_ID=236787 /ORGANISM="Florenciella parvula, Strain CCMP2471" /LENGTH=145 /DNA_ID=CAMNT_0007588549 /DNA_START=83 /DNA_END=517 /DNA_ORIENTATION=+
MSIFANQSIGHPPPPNIGYPPPPPKPDMGPPPPANPTTERTDSVLCGRMVDASRVVQAMQCVVCVEPCQEAVITPCGHTYCRKCITECLNLKHSCPTCSQPVTVDQLVRNHAVDGAVDLLYSQAAGADDALTASLIAGTGFGAAV